MMRAFWGATITVAAALLCACGATTTAEGDGTSGSLRMQLNGNIATSGSMATIVIRNVFDTSQNFLVECNQKDHTLNGEPFCDELTVLPPGVYEVIVQSGDPNCHAEQDWYKVIVQPGETVELQVNLICGGANGGLDIIVTENTGPVITDIDFTFGTGETANKFVCQNDGDVNVTITVTDQDTPCDQLTFDWLLKAPGTTTYTTDTSALFVPGSETVTAGPDNTCLFTATIDANAALGDYSVKFTVSDGTQTASFAFPIHIIDCELQAACPNDLSGIGQGNFRMTFDLLLPVTATDLYALLNQRASCADPMAGTYWDLRVAGGWLHLETAGAPGTYTNLMYDPQLDDGLPHHVVITRVAQQVFVSVDGGAPVFIGISNASFPGLLPTLNIGSDVCQQLPPNGDDTHNFLMSGGSLTNICVEPIP